jgi:hypothetical protein
MQAIRERGEDVHHGQRNYTGSSPLKCLRKCAATRVEGRICFPDGEETIGDDGIGQEKDWGSSNGVAPSEAEGKINESR